jgi:hypothetical protein
MVDQLAKSSDIDGISRDIGYVGGRAIVHSLTRGQTVRREAPSPSTDLQIIPYAAENEPRFGKFCDSV